MLANAIWVKTGLARLFKFKSSSFFLFSFMLVFLVFFFPLHQFYKFLFLLSYQINTVEERLTPVKSSLLPLDSMILTLKELIELLFGHLGHRSTGRLDAIWVKVHLLE